MHASSICVAAIALWIVTLPTAAQAEQPKRLPQVGLLVPPPPAGYDPANNPFSQAMLEGLKGNSTFVKDARGHSARPNRLLGATGLWLQRGRNACRA